ncbi:MAG TPA: presqualene diphosphate synthase HpnD [Vicinamibacteria bacterium]|nr:presqualene diphosphate synthase HpnD [Vicinamibacteria bacterium]
MELKEAYSFCRKVAHRKGPNFSVGFRFLPRPKRDAVYATYAFCRFVDDVVDEKVDTDVRELIDRWERELDDCYAGRPSHPVAVALADTAARYPIPKSAFRGLMDGCRMDLVKTRYASFAELMEYSDLVATTISTMSLAIFGYGDDAAVERGRDLATAFQLTNILRDVGEDVERGRIYLPQDELARFGVCEEDLRLKKVTRGFADLMRFQVQRVREHYDRAEPLLGLIDADARRCTRLMGSVYYRVLERIEGSGYDVFGGRVGLTFAEKITLVARTCWNGSPAWIHLTP